MQKLNIPKTFPEALRQLAQEIEEKEIALQKVDNLNTALDNLLDWSSIIKVAKHNKVSEKYFNWRLLKAKSIEMGFAIKKAESPRFGYQNLYNEMYSGLATQALIIILNKKNTSKLIEVFSNIKRVNQLFFE